MGSGSLKRADLGRKVRKIGGDIDRLVSNISEESPTTPWSELDMFWRLFKFTPGKM